MISPSDSQQTAPGRSPHGAGADAPSGKHLLRDLAYRRIKQKIVSLEYAIGRQLMEQEVCEQIGIGRTPVREALQRLAAEKLVRIIPRKGIFVSDINAWELDRLIEARSMLEIHCIRKAARIASRAQIDHLRTLLAAAPPLVAGGRICELLDIDRNFHMALVAILDNPFIAEMADKIYDRLARTWFLSFSRRSSQEIKDTVREHLNILDALETGRPEEAEAAVTRHLEQFRAKVAPRPQALAETRP